MKRNDAATAHRRRGPTDHDDGVGLRDQDVAADGGVESGGKRLVGSHDEFDAPISCHQRTCAGDRDCARLAIERHHAT